MVTNMLAIRPPIWSSGSNRAGDSTDCTFREFVDDGGNHVSVGLLANMIDLCKSVPV